MRISSTLTGHAQFDDELAKITFKISRASADIVEEKAERIVEIAQEEIRSGEKSGRIYDGHQASAPGESPADYTGRLADSFTISSQGSNQYQAVRTVENTAPYAGTLEYGGFAANGAFIAPRPYMSYAVDVAEAELYEDLQDFVNGL